MGLSFINSYKYTNLPYNTLIVGEGVNTTTAGQLETLLGLSGGDVSYFNLNGNDIEARIDVSYDVPSGSFQNNTDVLRYFDYDDKIERATVDSFRDSTLSGTIKYDNLIVLGSSAFRGTDVTRFKLESVSAVPTNCFRDANISGIINIDLDCPSLVTFGNSSLRSNTNLTGLITNNVTLMGFAFCQDTSLNYIEALNENLVLQDNAANNSCFLNVPTNGIAYFSVVLETVNGGSIEPDIGYLKNTRNWDINWKPNNTWTNDTLQETWANPDRGGGCPAYNSDGTQVIIPSTLSTQSSVWDLSTPYDFTTRSNQTAISQFTWGSSVSPDGKYLIQSNSTTNAGTFDIFEFNTIDDFRSGLGSVLNTSSFSGLVGKVGKYGDYFISNTKTNTNTYNLTTPFDLSTAVLIENWSHSDFADQHDQGACDFGRDGFFFYHLNTSNNGIVRYELSTPYDLTTRHSKTELSFPFININFEGFCIGGNNDDHLIHSAYDLSTVDKLKYFTIS